MSVRELDELIRRAKRLEEQGRKIAFERERPISATDEDWLRKVIYATINIGSSLEELAAEEYYKWITFIVYVRRAAEELEKVATYHRGTKRMDAKVDERTKRVMKEMDNSYRIATGKERCTWLLNVIEPYTFSAAVNDLTACFHKAIEKMEEVGKEWAVEGRCIWRR